VARLGKLDVPVGEAPQETDLAVYNLFQVQSLKAWYQDSVDALATSDQRSLNLLVAQLAHSIRKLRCACDSEALTKAFEEAPHDVQAKLTKLNNTMKARLRVFNDLATDLVASTHEVDADAKKHAQMIIETEHRLASEIGGLSSRIARVSFQNLTHECRAVEDLLQDSYVPHIYPRLDAMSSQTAVPSQINVQSNNSLPSAKQASTTKASKNQASSKQANFDLNGQKRQNTKMLAPQQDANMLQTLHAKLLRVYAKLSSMRDDLAKAQVEGNLVLAGRLEANIKQLKSNALAIGGACQLAANANRKRVLVNMYTSSRGDYKHTKNVVSRLEKSIRHAKQPDMLAQWHYVQDRVHEQANGLRVFLTLEAKHEVDQVRRQAVKNMHRNAVLLFDLAEKALVPLDLSIAELSKDESMTPKHGSPVSTDLASNTFKACAQSLARKYSNDLARILHKLVALFPKSNSLQAQEQQREQQREQQEELAPPTQIEVLIVAAQDPQASSKQLTQHQEEKQHEKPNKQEKDQEEKQEEQPTKKEKNEEEEEEETSKRSKPQMFLPVPDLDSLEGVSSDSEQESYDSGQEGHDPEQESSDSGQEEHDPEQESSDSVQEGHDPEQESSDSVQEGHDPEQESSDSVQEGHDPEQESSDSGQEEHDPEQESYASETKSYDSQASYKTSSSTKRKRGKKQANKTAAKRAKPRSPRSPK
jgi:hypothetical protein